MFIFLYSRFGRYGSKSWSNYFISWGIELVYAGFDFPTDAGDYNVRSRSSWSILLDIVERFSHNDLWYTRFLLWIVCQHHGIVESNTTSNDINQKLTTEFYVDNSADSNGKFLTNDSQWKVFESINV